MCMRLNLRPELPCIKLLALLSCLRRTITPTTILRLQRNPRINIVPILFILPYWDAVHHQNKQ